MKWSIAGLFGIIATFMLAACSGNAPSLNDSSAGQTAEQASPSAALPPSVTGQPSLSTAPPEASPPSQPLSSDADNYQLGPGDKVRVSVYNESDLSGEFVVDSSGAVNLPLIGAIDARGATARQFQDRVTAKLQDGYLKDPKVSIEVLNYRPFFITGEVNKTGEFPYKSGLTLQDAVGVAGGYTYRANTKTAYIRRAGMDREQKVELQQRVPINPGDSIRIPERFF